MSHPKITGSAMLRRAWSSAPIASIGVLVVAALMSALLTAWVLGFARMSSELGNKRLDATSSLTRDLSAVGQTWVSWNDDSPAQSDGAFDDPEAWNEAFGSIAQQLTHFRSQLSLPLQSVVGQGQFRVLSTELPVDTVPGSDVRFPSVQPGYAPDLYQRIELKDGRYPQQSNPSDGIEILVSAASAERLSWRVGEPRTSVLIPDQPLVLVGTYDVKDPQDGYWEHATTSVLPYVDADPDAGTSVMATAYLAPHQVLDAPGTQRVDAWFPIDEIGGMDPNVLRQELTAVSAISSDDAVGLLFSSGLPAVLAHVVSDIEAVKSLALFLVAVPLLALLVSALVVSRALVAQHAQSLYVVSTRGGSRTQQVVWTLALGSVLVVPGIGLGSVAAWLLLDDHSVPMAGPVLWCGYGVIYVLMILLLLGFAGQRSRAGAQSGTEAGTGTGTQRWVVVSIVTAAVALGALYLVQSGLLATNDPLSYLMPALVTFAAICIGITLLKSVMAACSAVASRGKSVALYLGFAQASRAKESTVQGIATIIVMTAMIVMAGGLLVSLDSAVSTGAQERTGADIKLSGPFFVPQEVQSLDAIEEITGYSTVMSVNPAAIRTTAGQRGVRLYVAPAGQLSSLRSYQNLAVDQLQSSGEQLNVITTRTLDDLIATDAGHRLNTGAGTYSVNPIRIRRGIDGLNQTNSFLLADSQRIEELGKYRPTILLIDVEPSLTAQQMREVAAGLQDLFPGAAMELKQDALDQKRNDPTLKWLTLGVVAGLVVTCAAGASALWFAHLNQARTRKREAHILGHLGLSAPAIRAVTRASTLSWLLPSILMGSLSGGFLAWIALSVVDVSNITGLSAELSTVHVLYIVAIGIAGSVAAAGIAILAPAASNAFKVRKP